MNYKYHKYLSKYTTLLRQKGVAEVTKIYRDGDDDPVVIVLSPPEGESIIPDEVRQLHRSLIPTDCETNMTALSTPSGRSRYFGCFRKTTQRPGGKGKFINELCDIKRDSQRGLVWDTINRTADLFQAYGLIDESQPLKRENHLVECHRYVADDTRVTSPFALHEDDQGGVDFNTYTAIYYLLRSEGIREEGGNFIFRVINTEKKPSGTVPLDDITHTKGDTGYTWYKIPVATGRIVLMRGDVEHTPESVSPGSSGCRDSVVVQLERETPS